MNDFRPAGSSGGAPSGAAGGSLTGTYPNPTIATIPSGATATTQSAADASTKLATTAYVDTAGALKANLAGPTFTGSPVLPTGTTGTTQTTADNSTKLATTAYVDTASYESWRITQEMTTRSILAWSAPLSQAWSNGAPATQAEVAVKVFLPRGGASVTGCIIVINTAGGTLTSGQNLVTLYSLAGTKQGSTADQSAIWTTAGSYSAAFTGGPFAMTGAYCWVSVLSNGTTPATFRTHASSAGISNAAASGTALSGANAIAGRIGTGITAPATFTPGNLVNAGSVWPFIALY